MSLPEQLERRVSYQPTHQVPREVDQIPLERENQTPSIKEREEENLNEISFGTRRSLEADVENAFGESNVGVFSQKENDIEQTLKNSLTDQINPFHAEEGLLTQEQRNEDPFELKNNQDKDDIPNTHQEEEEDEDDNDDDWSNDNSNPRRSNCGRNIS